MGSRLEQKSNLVRKRIEGHTFSNEEGDEYEGSKFGGFPEYFRRKKIKLQNLDAEIRANSGDKPQIFKGIVCHVNGYTQPSLNDLHTMIVQHGGGFVQYLDGKTMVTHIIASNLTPKKKEEFRKYRIVKPAWIVNSVSAGKLQPWDNYRVVDEGVGQKVLGFQSGQMVSQANRKAESYREQTDASWYTSQLKGRSPRVPGNSQDLAITQTVTPNDDIEDDEYPLPEITSSIERAMEEDDGLEPTPTTRSKTEQPRNLLEVRTELGTRTPPPSSPVAAESKDDVVGYAEETAAFYPNAAPLRPREGSQEPDYSMAVVRDSEALRSVSPARLAQMTAEEHNALLLSDPKIRKSTVVNPDFLEQYYRESRLH
ncbi:DNA repair protein, partial [Hortaea werneckii]